MEYREYDYRNRPGPDSGNRRIRIQAVAVLIGVIFAVVLAAETGRRLSDEALAVLAGAVCGVGASIPTSLLVIWATRRREDSVREQRPHNAYPPVVVVQPPQSGGLGLRRSEYLPPSVPAGPRRFTVVGGEAEELVYDWSQNDFA